MDYASQSILFLALTSQLITAETNFTTWMQQVRMKRQSGGSCTLPPYPANGRYTVGGKPDAKPGQTFDAAQLHVACHPGYRPLGDGVLYCVFGAWSKDLPQCVRHCKLDPHPSVRYRCAVINNGYAEGYRDCKEYEPPGTTVKPQCNKPNYYYTGVKSLMRCIDGRWDHIVVCTADCGRVTPEAKPLLIGGREAHRGEFPWHTGIYLKPSTAGEPHKQICGGSIISTKVIITAAHCFWGQGRPRPASDYAVAVGKLYRGWNHPLDDDAQKFDISEIKIPVRYQDASTNYQDDIAAVTLQGDIVYRPHVRPVCIDFDPVFDHVQLRDGNIGKVAGWGLTDKDGRPSPVLKVLELPYVKVERCIEEAPPTFRPFITSDKICAGYLNGSAVCKGDSGGGLVFGAEDRGVERHYLRGVVSTAPKSDSECNAFARTSFTQILVHSTFIEENTILFDANPTIVQQPDINAVCVLPPYPKHGTYTMVGTPTAVPGQTYLAAQLELTCHSGYVPETLASPSCSYGRWNAVLPNCVARCFLQRDGSATYRCSKSGASQMWDCSEFEPEGVKVKVECKPGFFSFTALGGECVNGAWNGNVICTSDCGRSIPGSEMQQPWTAALYRKDENKFLCGAVVVGPTTIITAGHCVWNTALRAKGRPEEYVVVAGTRYPVWDDPKDARFTQTVDVSSIAVPKAFGAVRVRRDDIAIVSLATALEFSERVRPLCLDLDLKYTPRDLERARGMSTSWSIVDAQGNISFENAHLQDVTVEHLPFQECVNEIGENLAIYLTSDKICAKVIGDKGICRGDSGLGLAIPANVAGTQRYFLKGISSNSFGPPECTTNKPSGFTSIDSEKEFLSENLK